MKKYLLVLLALVAFIKVSMAEEPAWSLWGNPKYITYDATRHEYINNNPQTELWRLGNLELTKPERVPVKTKYTITVRSDLFCERREQVACASMAAILLSKRSRRLVLINVEQTINENIPVDDRQYRVWPHLGLLFVGTVAHEEGWEVVMWDELVKGFAPMDKLVQPGDVVGLSCIATGMERAIELARKAKELGAMYCIAGNDSATFRANQILALPGKPVDVVFTSNSLTAVRSFLRGIEGIPLEALHIPDVQVAPGPTQRSNEFVQVGLKRKERQQLKTEGLADNQDVFVVPKLDLYPHWAEVWANYRATFGHKHRNRDSVKNSLGLLAQGCTRAAGGEICYYCTIEGVDDVRIPSHEYLRQTAEAYKAFGIDMVFNVTDSVYEMAAVPKALQELGITWSAMTIYGRSQGICRKPGLLDEWQKVATERLLLNVGMDSGDERMLSQGIVKSSRTEGSRLDENRRAVEHIRKSGAHLHCSLIFGSPGETLETCESSMRFLEWTIQTLGDQLDICETDIFWLNFGSPASKLFHDYSEARRLAALAGKTISEKEWYENFARHQEALVVPQVSEEAWYHYFTGIDLATAQAYNRRCTERMAKHTGSIRGRAFNPKQA